MDSQKIKQTVTEKIDKFKALPKQKQIIFASAAGGGLLVVIILIALLCFGGSGKGAGGASPSILEPKEITQVKNTVLGYDQSRNVETALKARCSSLEWKSGVSTDGRKFVEVFAVFKDTTGAQVLEDFKKKRMDDPSIPGNPYGGVDLKTHSLLPGDIIHAQFLLNADGTIELCYGAICNPDKSVKRAQIRSMKQITTYDLSTDKGLKMDDFLACIYKKVAFF